MEVSDAFVKHIEGLEGFRAQAYRDSKGVLTIGYGHVVKPKESYLAVSVISRDTAARILHQDTQHAVNVVNATVQVPLNQGQFDALVSFVFNVGEGAFRSSTLLRKLNAGHCCAVPDELRRWTRVAGAVRTGLILRRKKEIALFVGDS